MSGRFDDVDDEWGDFAAFQRTPTSQLVEELHLVAVVPASASLDASAAFSTSAIGVRRGINDGGLDDTATQRTGLDATQTPEKSLIDDLISASIAKRTSNGSTSDLLTAEGRLDVQKLARLSASKYAALELAAQALLMGTHDSKTTSRSLVLTRRHRHDKDSQFEPVEDEFLDRRRRRAHDGTGLGTVCAGMSVFHESVSALVHEHVRERAALVHRVSSDMHSSGRAFSAAVPKVRETSKQEIEYISTGLAKVRNRAAKSSSLKMWKKVLSLEMDRSLAPAESAEFARAVLAAEEAMRAMEEHEYERAGLTSPNNGQDSESSDGEPSDEDIFLEQLKSHEEHEGLALAASSSQQTRQGILKPRSDLTIPSALAPTLLDPVNDDGLSTEDTTPSRKRSSGALAVLKQSILLATASVRGTDKHRTTRSAPSTQAPTSAYPKTPRPKR
ncbi:hypothetical protein FVE85_3696 [Porphyridium purpureum]|uniref:Uncharacterized protein n=1 Tax=Porphyridium purpureum TaxID=35688 RepID=A0A5J4YLX9_PORPP|nr:hypothetical protein FVE85_3696 [Porphyridium purpureum]|eukprot:POR5473..scf249_10